MEETQMILTKRSNEKYANDGYLYVKDKINTDGTIQFWRCESKHKGCNGRIWTNIGDGSFNSQRREHSCRTVGNAENVELQRLNTAIKLLAENTMENPSQIRARAIANVPDAIKGNIPSNSVMSRTIQRRRNQNSEAPANPESRELIIIPECYSTYEFSPDNFERYLLADSGSENLDSERIMIFGREYNSSWSESMFELFMDGTFLICPSLFSQVFVILARKDGRAVFPVLFCLLPNKRTETYVKLFNMIRELWPQLNPLSISVDFELSIHQAIREVFPDVNIHGCLFHLVKNLKKHLSSNNLLKRYSTDVDFALRAKMVTSIAFVPENDILHAITSLENDLPPELDPILEWFTNTYIGRLRNNGTRNTPMFSSNIWSVYQRTLDGIDRTNNYAEACHRKIQLGFGSGIFHPTLWTFLDKLRRIQKTFDTEYERILAGHAPPKKRPRYEAADSRILAKVTNYNSNNVIEYLRGIAYNYNMD